MSKRVKENSGLVVEEGKEKARRDSSACSTLSYAQHRRSRSASEKSLNLPRVGGYYCKRKDLNESANSVPSTSSCRATPLHKNSCSKKDDISNHRVSLEQDIEQLHLRLQQEKSMRAVLEKAIGRASSTLSPGHRHFAAQTKELIAEIELLEEEVATREQHVLSLYRSIFENCVSQPTSEHSSVVTSPAHAKTESRKHPSIISSAFCSSIKFRLRKLDSLVTVNDSAKRSFLQTKTRHASLLNAKDDMHFQKSCVDHVKEPVICKSSAPRTLKDHLHQCPSKLAEEMVRCMAAVYCWLQSTSSVKEEQNICSSTKSPSSALLPRWDVEKKDGSTKSTVEISWISTDKSNFSRASYVISNYRVLVEQLEKVNVRRMDTDAQIAFWINLYNSLVMHAYLAFGIPHNSLRRLALFHKAAYNVGGHIVSASTIEQSIFCYHTPRVGQWLETVLSTAMRKRSREERKVINSKYGLQSFQPLICFALCTGAYSDPLLNVYTAANVKEELEAAKREFLQANVVIEKSKKIFLPKLIEKYAKEAGVPFDDIIYWVSENVDKKLHESIQKFHDGRPNKRTSQNIKWLPYSSKFRYVFSKELTEKPWWV
ncbi:uncharacterized protein LOC105155851 isoform X1 [Sesamum indicum]|uniref:Uncharacterized protein LOC105155851 isoform X1 n=1 Tax=Sesamum indicum TaxID=4182 RepID=A0A6I9SL44_SESIN|nr:uncharacterized protein LOC105155851 isoform X1 [Sesamum indicum]